jgi:hypothetical protein
MLKFYNTKILLDLDISDECGEVVTTNLPHFDKDIFSQNNNSDTVVKFSKTVSSWTLESSTKIPQLCMSIEQLYAFCNTWYKRCVDELKLKNFNFDVWFLDYLNCNVKSLEAEIDNLTYFDSYKLSVLRDTIKKQNYRCGLNPVTNMSAKLQPEISWVLQSYLEGNTKYEELLNEHIQSVVSDLKHKVKMYNALVPLIKLDTEINSIHAIPLNGSSVVYFQSPFSVSDFGTNYLYIRKILEKA